MQLQAMLLIVILFTNMTTLCKTQTPFNIITSPILNLLAPELFFLILAHPVYKMWIIQEPNTLELWNKLHFEEEQTESVYHV